VLRSRHLAGSPARAARARSDQSTLLRRDEHRGSASAASFSQPERAQRQRQPVRCTPTDGADRLPGGKPYSAGNTDDSGQVYPQHRGTTRTTPSTDLSEKKLRSPLRLLCSHPFTPQHSFICTALPHPHPPSNHTLVRRIPLFRVIFFSPLFLSSAFFSLCCFFASLLFLNCSRASLTFSLLLFLFPIFLYLAHRSPTSFPSSPFTSHSCPVLSPYLWFLQEAKIDQEIPRVKSSPRLLVYLAMLRHCRTTTRSARTSISTATRSKVGVGLARHTVGSRLDDGPPLDQRRTRRSTRPYQHENLLRGTPRRRWRVLQRAFTTEA